MTSLVWPPCPAPALSSLPSSSTVCIYPRPLRPSLMTPSLPAPPPSPASIPDAPSWCYPLFQLLPCSSSPNSSTGYLYLHSPQPFLMPPPLPAPPLSPTSTPYATTRCHTHFQLLPAQSKPSSFTASLYHRPLGSIMMPTPHLLPPPTFPLVAQPLPASTRHQFSNQLRSTSVPTPPT